MYIYRNQFFIILLATVLSTRLWVLSLPFLLSPNHLQQILTDSYHHYQIGLLLLLFAYPLKQKFNPLIILTIGSGIILEELPVILHDLGISHQIHYQSGLDIAIILIIIGMASAVTYFFQNKL